MTIRSRFFNVVCTAIGALQACMFSVSASDKAAPVPVPVGPSNSTYAKAVVGIARLSEISKGSKSFKEIDKKITAMQKALQTKLVSFQKEIAVKIKKLEGLKKSAVNSKVLMEKEKELKQFIAQKEKIIQGEQAKIQGEQQNNMVEIFRQVKLIFRSLGEKYGLTLIIDGEGALFYSPEKTIDLTQEALEQLNAIKTEPIQDSVAAPAP